MTPCGSGLSPVLPVSAGKMCIYEERKAKEEEMLGTIEFWSILISAVLSVVALVQSALASKDSKRANEISEEAKKVSEEANLISRNDLAESEKENYAIIKFASGISLEKKDFETLCNETTLDFDKAFFDSELFNGDLAEAPCICTEVENIGKGLVTSITVENICICSGNMVTIQWEYEGDNPSLYYRDACNVVREVVLEPGDKTVLNILLSELNDADENNWDCIYDAINTFMELHDNIMISMHLKMTSLNRSCYEQDVTGVFLRKKLQSNVFADCKKDTENA